MKTFAVDRVEELSDSRLLLHCVGGQTIEIHATGEWRQQWLEETPPGTTFDLVTDPAGEEAA